MTEKCACKNPTRNDGEKASDSESAFPKRKLLIELLYIDLTVCDRCLGAENALDDAVIALDGILELLDVNVEVRKTLISTEEQARNLQFSSSPTIRINGVDVQTELNENQCSSCSSLCDSDIDCRLWNWRGVEYTQPTKAMLVDAILSAIYSKEWVKTEKFYDVPKNIKRFFDTKK